MLKLDLKPKLLTLNIFPIELYFSYWILTIEYFSFSAKEEKKKTLTFADSDDDDDDGNIFSIEKKAEIADDKEPVQKKTSSGKLGKVKNILVFVLYQNDGDCTKYCFNLPAVQVW